jgi:hypothetical protein
MRCHIIVSLESIDFFESRGAAKNKQRRRWSREQGRVKKGPPGRRNP